MWRGGVKDTLTHNSVRLESSRQAYKSVVIIGVVCVALLFFVSVAESSLLNLTVKVYSAVLVHH